MSSDVRELPEMNAVARANTPAFRQVPAHISIRTSYLEDTPLIVLWDERDGGRHVDIPLGNCRKETIKIALRQLNAAWRYALGDMKANA